MIVELIVLLALIAFALITMLAYRLRNEGGRESGDLTGRGGSFFLGYWVRNWFYWFISPIESLSLMLGLSPFLYNVLAVGFGVAAMACFATGRLPLAGWMILLSGFADVMDGQIARKRGLASAQGAFLDSTLDRFSEVFVFIGLAAYFNTGFMAYVVLVALAGSLLVSYTRARGESLGVLCKGGWMQRAERILAIGFGAMLDPPVSGAFGREPGFLLQIILMVVAAGTVGTAVYRTWWIAKALEKK